MTVDYRVGDTREVIKTIPDGTVDLIATSPPFLALRSYVPADHEHKHAEIGSERNPAEFIDMLLGLTAEWGRVLAPHGSIAVELGDTYSGSGGGGGDYLPGGLRENQPGFGGSADRARNGNAAHWRAKNQTPDAWPQAKSLALIPQLYAVALAYGINPLTGQPSPAGRWLVRNVIVWHRPNPAVGALGDKVRPSTSYIVVATRSPKRWFDLTAVRTPHARNYAGEKPGGQNGDKPEDNRPDDLPTRIATHAGAPPLDAWFDHHDTWTLTTQPSRLAHYAMWPPKLAERLILMMCPSEVCRECGTPRRRIERSCTVNAKGAPDAHSRLLLANGGHMGNAAPITIGWSDCGHDNYRPGLVLDPFAGSGTTLAVADLHGRDATGIDFNTANRQLYPARYDEVKRALFGTQPELPGQLDMFEATS